MGDYTVYWDSTHVWFTGGGTYAKAWFFGREPYSVPDRLQSKGDHYPYGEQKGGTVPSFATYTRDTFTNLDYAINRYYSATTGRFLSPDPYQPSGGPANPGSWNRYSYVQGDPVNWNDPSGLQRISPAYCYWLNGMDSENGFYFYGFAYSICNHSAGGPLEWGGGGAAAADTIPKLDLSNRGLTCVKSYEGLSLTVYEDSAGHPTVGYGHLILKGEDFGKGITEPQAANLLRRDAAQAIKAVQDLVSVTLNQDQFDALVSFAFNLGRGNLAKSTLLANINAGNAVTEANFTDWNKAGGQVVEGLTARRKDEYSRFSTGTSTRCPK